MKARAHDIVEIDSCPLLAASMDGALPAARAIARALASGAPLDILVTATASGLDVDLKGHGPLNDAQRQDLARVALEHDLARLSNHGEIVLMRREPALTMGKAKMRSRALLIFRDNLRRPTRARPRHSARQSPSQWRARP
jgi:23S rRNA (uracil1939-C5)-methyltransferase